VGAGRADILDIVARREEGRRDRDTARERAHDHPDQCSARVGEARSRGQQGTSGGIYWEGGLNYVRIHIARSQYSLQTFRSFIPATLGASTAISIQSPISLFDSLSIFYKHLLSANEISFLFKKTDEEVRI